ncbi:MAG: hypothetical protein AAB968_03235 [Patescibacteria group bacterium]
MTKDLSGKTRDYYHKKGQKDASEGTHSRPSKFAHGFSKTAREANEAYDKGHRNADKKKQDEDDD